MHPTSSRSFAPVRHCATAHSLSETPRPTRRRKPPETPDPQVLTISLLCVLLVLVGHGGPRLRGVLPGQRPNSRGTIDVRDGHDCC